MVDYSSTKVKSRFSMVPSFIHGRSPGSNTWRYVSTIVLAIFWGHFALHRPETAYVYGIRTSNLGSEMSIDLSDPIKIKLFNQCGTRGPGSH